MDSEKLKPDQNSASKRRKIEKTVVKIRTSGGKVMKNEGPPSDLWSWRKYGQKTIKGSPHPRGYYRCSTSKGCLAKKQVERCRTDASMIIITYTCTHNHPGPDITSTIQTQQPTDSHTQNQPTENLQETHEIEHLEEEEEEEEKEETLVKQNLLTKTRDGDGDKDGDGERFHYIQCSEDIVIDREEDPFAGNSENLLEEKPISCSKIDDLSKLELSEENDFFDELDELPTPPFFTSFQPMRSYFSDDRIHVALA